MVVGRVPVGTCLLMWADMASEPELHLTAVSGGSRVRQACMHAWMVNWGWQRKLQAAAETAQATFLCGLRSTLQRHAL